VAGVGEKSLQQIRPSRRTILDGRDGAGERAGIPRAERLNRWKIVVQALSVKQKPDYRKNNTAI